MKKLAMTAVTIISLAAPALAQGLPADYNRATYDPRVLPKQQHHERSLFSELFGPARNDGGKSVHTAENNAAQNKAALPGEGS